MEEKMKEVLASRNYDPGDIIYREQAFAKIVNRKFKDVLCESCCIQWPATLRACTQCLHVKYCDKQCQKNDWSSHKLECKYLKNLPQGSLSDFVRLLGKIILKIKGKDWKNIKTKVFGKEVSFDDIDCHYKEMTENSRMILFFEEVKELTGRYIGFENLPDDEILIKIVGKVKFGMFRNQIRLSGFYIGAAVKFSFECIPNSNASIWGNEIKIWAFKKIRKGKDKITIPGRMVLLPEIRTRFVDDDFSACKCTHCSLPYEESILFKIIDKKRAFSVIEETKEFLDAAEAFHGVLSLPEAKEIADRLLREQEGVLGDTHYLRMGLLSVRTENIKPQEHSLEMKRLLMKVVRSMTSAFGEYYMELAPTYKVLRDTNLHLGFPFEAMQYAKKAAFMEKIMTDGMTYFLL